MPDYTENRLIVRLRGFDAAHYARTTRYARQVERLYNTACDEIAAAAGRITIPEDGVFSFDDFPATRRQAQGILNRLAKRVEAVIETGTRTEWQAACDKSDTFLSSILRTSRLSPEEAAQYQARNLEALQAFQQRKAGGLGLSQRVWKYTEEFKTALELGIDVAVGEGRSAGQLSRDLRQYLQNPDKLFRRVRDKGGNLRLSKAASMYHPGQGVYRSSAKNAERLARTEVNMAYREAEYLRWQQLDFVVGFRVMLSNNHTTTDSKGKKVPLTDICDELAGDYPKTFKFLGWHPQCRCVVVPIMSDYDEYNDDRANRLKAIVRGKTYKSLPSRRTVRDVPAAFRSHIDAIAERAKGWKSMPYYIRDNFKKGVISGGLLPTIPQKAQMPGTTAKPPEPCTEFDSEIANFKKWAYSFGLDVSRLDPLRTAGDRAGLNAEVKRLQEERLNRMSEWLAARSEVDDFADKAVGFPDIVKEIKDALTANEIRTTNYYGDCISRLKAFFASLPGKLSAAKAKKGSYSANMPTELQKGGKWLRGDDYEYSREFFDLIDPKKPIPLTIHKKNGNDSYHSALKGVVLDMGGTRSSQSPYYRRALIYHEFGHGIDYQRGLRHSKEVKDLRDKQIARLREKVETTVTKRKWDPDKKEFVTETKKTKLMKAKVLSERLDRLYRKIYSMDDATFTKRGITKHDVIEQIAAVQDTLKSLIISVGWGHSTSYFKGAGKSEAEYLAHCFENAFIGNRVFQKYLPTEYAEMIAFIRSLK
jgi:hypothetical protein|nr:MAG TPA: minor capsid protein [Caudoviricetes sp.]